MFGFSTFGQTLEKKFIGCWGDTTWDFKFQKNGKYKRTSSGHYGFTEVSGKYTVKNDTIHLKSGFKNTNGTVNEFYIIENDSILVDMNNGYGYTAYKDVYPSRIYCDLKYPLVSTAEEIAELNIERYLNLALNSALIKKFYHFDELPERNLIIAEYYNLRANIEVDGKTAIYKPLKEIQDKFYIEIIDFSNAFSLFSATFRLHGEGITFKVWFDTPCTKCNVNTSVIEN